MSPGRAERTNPERCLYKALCFPALSLLGLCMLRLYPGDAALSPGGLGDIPLSQCHTVVSELHFWGTWSQMDSQPNAWVSIRSGSDPPAPVAPVCTITAASPALQS